MSQSQTHERARLYSEHIATLQQRYALALERCGADRAVIFAGTPRYRDRDDQTFPFTADPYFQQWIPVPDAAGSIVEIRPGHRPHLVLAQEEDFWHAPPRLPPDYALAEFEVTQARRDLAAPCLPKRNESTLVIGSMDATCEIPHILDSAAFLADLDYGRAVKTAYEIDCIAAASRVAAEGHRAVAQALRPGTSEFELHMIYCAATQQTDEDLPYPNIVGLNEHAATLHYQHRDRVAPESLSSLLIDAGARCNGYASDITRTYGGGDERFAALIEAVDGMQQEICRQTAAGTEFIELNELCHQLLASVLAEFGFIACSAETAWEIGATTAFLPHGLGHLLGLQVHDVGGHCIDRAGTSKKPPERHPFLRLTRCLEPDMVLTIEPGLYFIEQLIDEFAREKPGVIRLEALKQLLPCGGIRIEDNIRVESSGHSNLTRIAFGE